MDFRPASASILLLLVAPLACADDVVVAPDDMIADDEVGETGDDEPASSTDTQTDESSSDDTSETSSTDTDTTGNECLMCGITLDSTLSSSVKALPGTEFLGQASLAGNQIIYAFDEVGSGRVIYTGDTNILNGEITDCPLWEWLGQSGEQLPEVLAFGRFGCTVDNELGDYPNLTANGNTLPTWYVGDPASLAEDYDVVVYCATKGTSADEAQTLVDFVTEHGGGLYLAAENLGFISQDDFDMINTIANPLGAEFEPTELAAGQAAGDFECFPDPQ
ncbi:hypothetical protein ACNOYE_16700 [Nannocystaceae bacterium ST9]